jgi:hypothetical protein
VEGSCEFFLGWPQSSVLPISASVVAGITGVSHWRPPALFELFTFYMQYPNWIDEFSTNFKFQIHFKTINTMVNSILGTQITCLTWGSIITLSLEQKDMYLALGWQSSLKGEHAVEGTFGRDGI